VGPRGFTYLFGDENGRRWAENNSRV